MRKNRGIKKKLRTVRNNKAYLYFSKKLTKHSTIYFSRLINPTVNSVGNKCADLTCRGVLQSWRLRPKRLGLKNAGSAGTGCAR